MGYQVVLLGELMRGTAKVKHALLQRVHDLGLPCDALRFLTDADLDARDRRLPTVALYFGSRAVATNTIPVQRLLTEAISVIPIVSDVLHVHDEIPPQLRHVNALELNGAGEGTERIASLVLEIFRLLRRERRLFISYRRVDAQPFADRLYDELDARGFDVFIDVRSVPPGVDFQSELWHRMSDTDVVVLIDTPGFRNSRWTVDELARANATNIQILHLLWPEQKEDPESAFSHFFKLSKRDFLLRVPMRGQFPSRSCVNRICNEVERLRARAIAARQRYLVENFCDAARDVGLDPSVQPERWISVDRPTRPPLAVVPAIGVPTADRINAIFESVVSVGPTTHRDDCWVVYDNRGILARWLEHLDWLDQHLPIRAIRMSHVPDALKALKR